MKKFTLLTSLLLTAFCFGLRAEVEFPFSRDEYFEQESQEIRNLNYVLTNVTATKDDELSEEWELYVWHLAFENTSGVRGGAMLTLKNAADAIPAGTYTIEMFGDAEASDGIDEEGNPTGCYIYDPSLGESTPYLFVTSGSLTIGYNGDQLTVALNGKTYWGSTVTFKYPTADVYDPAASETSDDEAYSLEPDTKSNINIKVVSADHNLDKDSYAQYEVDDYILSLMGENGERILLEIWLDAGLATEGHLPAGTYKVFTDIQQANGLNWLIIGSTGYSAYGFAYSLATVPNSESADIYFLTGGTMTISYDTNGKLVLTATFTTAHGSVISVTYSESVNTGLQTVDASQLHAYGENGTLHFSAQGGEKAVVLDAQGRKLTEFTAHGGMNSVAAQQGVVILRLGDKTAKVLVK